jgi:hypothetical protein
LDELQYLLDSYGKDVTFDSTVDTSDQENVPEQPGDWKQTISRTFATCTQLLTAEKASASLPRHEQDKQEVNTTGACSRTRTGDTGTHNFVLLCIPFMRVATKLYQPEICRINSDREFLQLLRHYYQTKRGRSPWKWLRKVKSINFVKLEMYRSHLADIRLCPSVPPPERIGTEYAFDGGRQLDVIPPIGPNFLTHLFEHPEHADVVPTIWNRIPRKLRAELTACPTRGSSLGWGLQLAEGMEWFFFFVLGCGGFVACLLVAVVWSVARDDVQGGFSIGGFLLAFLVFCGGIAHTAVSE